MPSQPAPRADDGPQVKQSDQHGSMVVRAGPIQLDVPRSVGYFGGLAVAVGVGLLQPELGVFIAAVPFVKMLAWPDIPQPLRFLAQAVEGAGQPLGSTGQGTVRRAR